MWGLLSAFLHTWQTYEWPQASLSPLLFNLYPFFSAQSLNELALTPRALHCFHSRLPIKQCELNSLSGWPRDLLSVSPNHQSQLSCYISVKLSSSSLFSLLSRWWHLQLRCGDLCRPNLYSSFQWGASLLKHTHVYTRKKIWAHLCIWSTSRKPSKFQIRSMDKSKNLFMH